MPEIIKHKANIYIETSAVSYLTAGFNRYPVIAGHQQIILNAFRPDCEKMTVLIRKLSENRFGKDVSAVQQFSCQRKPKLDQYIVNPEDFQNPQGFRI